MKEEPKGVRERRTGRKSEGKMKRREGKRRGGQGREGQGGLARYTRATTYKVPSSGDHPEPSTQTCGTLYAHPDWFASVYRLQEILYFPQLKHTKTKERKKNGKEQKY